MNAKLNKHWVVRLSTIVIGVILATLTIGFSFKSYSERMHLLPTDAGYHSSQQIIDPNGHVIDVKYLLEIKKNNSTWLVNGKHFQVLSQGLVHQSKNSMRLEIMSGEFIGEVAQHNQDILFQWLKIKTAGQEVILMREGQCWRIDDILILLCPS